MTGSKIVVSVFAIVAVVALVVVWSIHIFGAENTQAFAGVMSFLAVVVAAGATVVYVRQTADIAKAARESAIGQGHLARLMEKDLQFRVQPYLRYEPQASSAGNPEGQIRNEGNGAAVNVRVSVYANSSGREFEILRIPALAPRPDRVERTIFTAAPNEHDHSIRIVCTDSLELNEYFFEWKHGRLISCTTKPYHL